MGKVANLDDDLAELQLAKVRARIRRNFPNERAALQWRKEAFNRFVSTCARFAIERHGEGEAARFTAKLQPATVIGHRLYTIEAAKEVCERHASPLPLEAPAIDAGAVGSGVPAPIAAPEASAEVLPIREREPGEDDE